ncbi:MAG: SemiSWEET transporter [Rhodothermales bacterium]|nr:SemiSWEET transporter [Rhodothermales bacterium]
MDPSPLVTGLGFVAATLTTLSFLPQVLKVWRRRQADDISLATFGMFCAGVVLWLAYGLLTGDPPLIVANVVTLALAGSVLVLALRYRR